MQMLDLKAQYLSYKDEIDAAVKGVIDSTCFIGGEEITSLENELSAYVGVPFSVGCSSGTDALLLALMAGGVSAGDEVITTAFTFIATAEVPKLLGAKPVFVDVDKDTYNIDISKIEQAITSKTKAIVPVSLFGLTAEMDAVNEIAAKHNLVVIEDAAQSFGAEYHKKKSCNLSAFACTSFFPAKPLGCYGDGGAVFCRESTHAKHMKMLLNHGMEKRYHHDIIGFNGRLDAIQAAILRVKLRHFDREVKKRIEIAKHYSENLKSDFIRPQEIPQNCQSVFAQYCYTLPSKEKREGMIEHYKKSDIPCAVYYPIPLHLQKAFQDLNYKKGDLPVTEDLSDRIIAIPLHPFLKEADRDKVISSTLNFS